MERKCFMKKMTSLVLAVAMMFSIMVVLPENVSAADKSLGSSGGSVTITDEECYVVTKGYTWISYKPKADGYLQLKFKPASAVVSYPYGTAQLFAANKTTALSSVCNFFTDDNRAVFNSEYYGVKKNKMYYISVGSVGGVAVSAKFKKVKDKSGTKKGRALNLKKGKAATSVITAGNNKTKWYKFTLSKPSKFNVYLQPYLTGDVNVTIKGPGAGNSTSGTIRCREVRRNYDGSIDVNGNSWGVKRQLLNTTGRYRQGTYYISIRPTTKTCTGYYKLNWK